MGTWTQKGRGKGIIEGIEGQEQRGYTDKKENKIFILYKKIQNGAVAKLQKTVENSDILLTCVERCSSVAYV